MPVFGVNARINGHVQDGATRGDRPMRLVVKRAAEIALCRSGVTRLLRRLRRDDVLVLAYHNVVPDGAVVRGERTLHVSQGQFQRHLALLSRTHHFIPVEQISRPGHGKPRVVLTFDDAYRGAVELGTEVLRELQAPATIFVPPACLGGQQFWWDVLSSGEGMASGLRESALSELAGKSADILARANRLPDLGDAPVYERTATESELDVALAFDGLTLGSHAWSHPNLAALEGAELAEQLVRPLDWLRDRYPERTAEWLSYPYGRWSDAVAMEARRAGYRGAFRIEGGWIPPACDPFGMPRLNVPAGLSVRGLELRGAGLMAY
jgi:peptidoglycan/xylan/chitin deacetylase (PgdA/CDA1 family)